MGYTVFTENLASVFLSVLLLMLMLRDPEQDLFYLMNKTSLDNFLRPWVIPRPTSSLNFLRKKEGWGL